MSSKPGRGPLKVRVKSGKGRSQSSRLWLERQLNDPYVARAQARRLARSSAFKLIEIDDKHHLLKAARGWSTSAPHPAAGARSRPSGWLPPRAGDA